MLKNFWYAVEFATGSPPSRSRCTCLGQHFVL